MLMDDDEFIVASPFDDAIVSRMSLEDEDDVNSLSKGTCLTSWSLITM